MATTTSVPTTQESFSLLLPQPYAPAALLALAEKNPFWTLEQSSEGFLIVSPSVSLNNKGELELAVQILAWNKRVVFGEVRGLTGGVRLPKGGDYAPDAFVISGSVWDALADDEIDDVVWIPVLPTAVFELLSPSNKTVNGYAQEFKLKLDDCERSAVPLVVLLDPETDTTVIRRPNADEVILRTPTVAFDELPGLELDVAAIFAACKSGRKQRPRH